VHQSATLASRPEPPYTKLVNGPDNRLFSITVKQHVLTIAVLHRWQMRVQLLSRSFLSICRYIPESNLSWAKCATAAARTRGSGWLSDKKTVLPASLRRK
jgi:hypothetical protein